MNPSIIYTKNFFHKQHILCSFIILLLFSFSGGSISYAQPVSVGAGSYSTTLPSGAIGPKFANGQDAIPKITTAFSQPVQTNDFWSSLIFPFFNDPHSAPIFAHPLNVKAVNNGLQVGYTPNHIIAGSDHLYPFSQQLTVGVNGLSASETKTKSYGDWTVTARWEDGDQLMEATFGHGLPYVFFKIEGGDAVITSQQTANVWFNQAEVLGVTIDGKHYGIFAPTGSSWSGTSTFQSCRAS